MSDGQETPEAPVQDAASATLNPFQPIQPSGETEAQKAFMAIVPDAYKTKEYVQNSLKSDKPFDAFFSQFDNAQSLIGQRTGLQVPTETSTPEQVKEWRKALGVPDDAAAYVPKEITWNEEDKAYGEHVTKQRVPGVFEALAAKAHELNLTPKQFQDLTETYDTAMVKGVKDSLKAQVDAQIERDKDFTQRLDAKYGDKRAQVLETGRKMLEASLDKSEIDDLGDLPPAALAKLSHALYKVNEKYVREDKPFGATSNAPTGKIFSTQKEVSDAAMALMQDPNYRDDRTNPARHKELVKAVKDIYDANAKLF